ncbi:MAG: AgmX/PglI C-terminal domain-containing protein [Deltaproteobacteria bacterium]|nr:MAG: AgmX/PglI C-terminal domain-containing protein [Deltaproteobacteria bacterium]
MKQKHIILIFLIIFIRISPVDTVLAKPEANSDRTLSPYFWVKSDDPAVDQLPLKSTSAKVNISGVIANVIVTQVYKNTGNRPLEAVYVFPASTRAAVYGMKMTIGERTITAKIRKREEARQDYQQAKQMGKSASLLEQHRPNVFQMNVANILPQDIIRVELKYTELLISTDTIYEFVYPTVVGPRYSETPVGQQAPPSERWVENPYLHQGEAPPYEFDITVKLAAGGLPIQKVTCPSHSVDMHYISPDSASVSLHHDERRGGNRDFILKYRLAGGKIKTGLLLSDGENEQFFLLMVQPPKRVIESQIPPREYIFIVDVSGSMHGFPLDVSKKLLKDLIGNLRPIDRFNVLLFAGGSSMLSEKSLSATPNNVVHAINVIERQRGGGGTRLLPALNRALSLPEAEGYSRTIVIASDGYVSVEEEVFDLMRNHLGKANMFVFGIGSSVNRHLIEGMARIGMGEPFIVLRPEEAAVKAKQFRKLIQSPVLTGIELDFGKFDVFDVEPTSIPDVMAHRPVIVFGKWRGPLRGELKIRGISGDHDFIQKINVADAKPKDSHAALRYLWARYRIGILSDYNRLSARDDRIEEVTRLGLLYNLLTAYTSFVAVDSRVRLKDGQATTVTQPLPLPQGVSDYAVGGQATTMNRISGVMAAAPSAVHREIKGKDTGLGAGKIERYAAQDSAAEAEARKPLLKVANITVGKGVSKRSVKKLLEKQLPEIDACYKSLAINRPISKHSVVFEMMIDSSGNIANLKMVNKGMNDSHLADCIMRHLKKLQFPIEEGKKRVRIIVKFVVK